MRVLLYGSDSASLVALRALHRVKTIVGAGPDISKLDVVCPVPKLFGKGKKRKLVAGAVRDFCLENEIKIYDAPLDKGLPGDAKHVKEWQVERLGANYDIGVVVSFGYFMPRQVLQAFPLGAINVHPSLLPQYRGAAPIQRCLMRGDTESGCSLIRVDPVGWDSGRILRQDRHAVRADDTFTSLSARLLDLGATQLVDVLGKLATFDRDKQIELLGTMGSEQSKLYNGNKPRKALKIKAQTGCIKFQSFPADKIFNYWRGLESNGGIFANMVNVGAKKNTSRISLDKVLVATNAQIEKLGLGTPRMPGSLIVGQNRKSLFAMCVGGQLLEIVGLTVAGKKPCAAESFINGYCLSNDPNDWPFFL